VKYVHVVRWAVAAAIGLACLASAVAPGAAEAAGALTFSAPAKIANAPYASTHDLTALNCISTTLCVAGDAAGNLITTTEPTSGAAAWTVAEQVDPSAQINAVSCSSQALCVAAGNDGAIIHSTNPTGGSSAWKLTNGVFRPGNALTSVSCPTKKLCFGVDKRGQLIYSRNPTGSAKTWKFAHILTYSNDWLASIKCPTTSECIAVDRRGHTVLHSTKPTGGKKAWHLTTLNTRARDNSLPTISCASKSLCVIAGGQGPEQIPFTAPRLIRPAASPRGASGGRPRRSPTW
jgi:hypothetical protein